MKKIIASLLASATLLAGINLASAQALHKSADPPRRAAASRLPAATGGKLPAGPDETGSPCRMGKGARASSFDSKLRPRARRAHAAMVGTARNPSTLRARRRARVSKDEAECAALTLRSRQRLRCRRLEG